MPRKGYTAFVLSDEDRAMLLDRFPPAYPQVSVPHITEQFGAPQDTAVCERESTIKITGVMDDKIGSQALLAEVDGTRINPHNNRPYHITLSYNPFKKNERGDYYSSVTSGLLLAEGKVPVEVVVPPIEIKARLSYLLQNPHPGHPGQQEL